MARRLFWSVLSLSIVLIAVCGQKPDLESCTLKEDDVCHPKCSTSCSLEMEQCKEPSECTEDKRQKLQEEDQKCRRSCIMACFSENKIEPQCENDQKTSDQNKPAPPCGSCYGAQEFSPSRNGCCNTCQEVRQAYEAKRWNWPGNHAIEQCKGQPDSASQPPPPPSAAVCASKLSCQDCFLSGCGWCISTRRCVEDKAWMCQGENDHIGRVGTVKACPSHEERKAKRDQRKSDEDEARAERASRLLSPGPGQDAGAAGMDEARARAKARLEALQQEELARVRREEGLADQADAQGPTTGTRAVDPAVQAEIERRAARAGEGSKQPYEVLELDTDAQMHTIRKAYRRLSLMLHPDKVPAGRLRELAQAAFVEVVAAYEILGDPDKRAAFDDMGGKDQAQFHTYWEWTTFGKGEAPDFYTGEKLITRLTEKLWPRRVAGDSMWLLEFYAPWCSACGTFVQDFKKIARILQDDEIEVGAVNCEKNKVICGEWFAISSYPTLMMVGSGERGTQQLYPRNRGKGVEEVVEWARLVAQEWKYLYKGHMDMLRSESNFTELVLRSEDLWFVVFTDGVHCGPCRTAMTNALRLAAGLSGVAKVGTVDCEEPETHALCYDSLKLPPPPHAPQIRIFRAGKKDPESSPGYVGELLYNANEVQPHVALQLVELVARNALADKLAANALAAAGRAGDYEGDADKPEPPPDPPRPPPMWNGPSEEDLPRGVSWGGFGGRSMAEAGRASGSVRAHGCGTKGFHNAIGGR